MYKNELTFLKENIKKIYGKVMKEPLKVMEKGHFDTVTSVDYAIETAIIEALKLAYPEDNIISEEFNPEATLSKRTWVIDPIDGTVNFARRTRDFGVQLALFVDKEIVLSYIYLPGYSEEYYAIAGQGAYLNDKKISKINVPVNQTIMSFNDFIVVQPETNAYQEKIFLALKEKLFRTRILGSSAIEFTHLAMSMTDALICRTNNIWDLAPGMLLIQETGAILVNQKLEPYKFGDYALYAFNNPDFINVLREVL